MVTRISSALSALALAASVCLPVAQAAAEGAGHNEPFISSQNARNIGGEQYIPGIWIDPDGCAHWVMDDGVEGYMSPKVDRKGIPDCRRANTCGVMNSDQFFATGSHRISQHGQQRIRDFFASSSAIGFVVAGHTDSRASDSYNMKLSYNRAMAVAKLGRSVGANITDVRGYGERQPIASNATAHGMSKNRRVEIICFQ